jgi:hypothetical protein
MSEMRRVLKGRGWVGLQIPISLSLDETYRDPSITSPLGRARAFGQEDHVRIYGMDFHTRLEAAGFRVQEFRWVEEPDLERIATEFGLDQNMSIYIAWKEGLP